jgi:hypothetical protein
VSAASHARVGLLLTPPALLAAMLALLADGRRGAVTPAP